MYIIAVTVLNISIGITGKTPSYRTYYTYRLNVLTRLHGAYRPPTAGHMQIIRRCPSKVVDKIKKNTVLPNIFNRSGVPIFFEV